MARRERPTLWDTPEHDPNSHHAAWRIRDRVPGLLRGHDLNSHHAAWRIQDRVPGSPPRPLANRDWVPTRPWRDLSREDVTPTPRVLAQRPARGRSVGCRENDPRRHRGHQAPYGCVGFGDMPPVAVVGIARFHYWNARPSVSPTWRDESPRLYCTDMSLLVHHEVRDACRG
jgi:hypothetical protein